MFLWGGWALSAQAASQISGQILDRNGQPVVRAIVSLTPPREACPDAKELPEGAGCTVELVTDHDGRFLIDYLRDHTGEKIKLAKKTEYTLEVFKVKYHTFKTEVAFRHGVLEVEPVTMVEDKIALRDFPENLDPGMYSASTNSGGATYEGQ